MNTEVRKSLKTIETDILDTLQNISSILVQRGIPCLPIDIKYLDKQIPITVEYTVLKQLILSLQVLFTDYNTLTKRNHRYNKYLNHFKNILDKHSNENSLYYFLGKRID